jgi:hypothetical protein
MYTNTPAISATADPTQLASSTAAAAQLAAHQAQLASSQAATLQQQLQRQQQLLEKLQGKHSSRKADAKRKGGAAVAAASESDSDEEGGEDSSEEDGSGDDGSSDEEKGESEQKRGNGVHSFNTPLNGAVGIPSNVSVPLTHGNHSPRLLHGNTPLAMKRTILQFSSRSMAPPALPGPSSPHMQASFSSPSLRALMSAATAAAGQHTHQPVQTPLLSSSTPQSMPMPSLLTPTFSPRLSPPGSGSGPYSSFTHMH